MHTIRPLVLAEFVVAMLGALLCGPAAAAQLATPRTAQAARPLAGKLDLSGSWITGTDGDRVNAKGAPFADCRHIPAYWQLTQDGARLRAEVVPERWNKGIAQTVEPGPIARGTVRGTRVELRDGRSRYRLRYDRATGHLIGTLDGRPFWAARQAIVIPSGCPDPR